MVFYPAKQNKEKEDGVGEKHKNKNEADKT